ncbi:hypothetical protein BURKHO8Y_380021 [Burkholderia sp. 8Y]|nr:hypothetical protein BURKHO8Y_380021 [Burkholderia sp. 8Y]
MAAIQCRIVADSAHRPLDPDLAQGWYESEGGTQLNVLRKRGGQSRPVPANASKTPHAQFA